MRERLFFVNETSRTPASPPRGAEVFAPFRLEPITISAELHSLYAIELREIAIEGPKRQMPGLPRDL